MTERKSIIAILCGILSTDTGEKKLFIDPYISGKMASITFVRDPIPISPFPIPQTTLGQHNLQIFVQKLV